MKFPNWFKISWWILLLILTGIIVFKRFHAIAEGQSVPADIFIFLIFVALMLVPVFAEIELFGIKLKKEIDELKSDIKIKLGEIKNEISNSQTQTLNATFQGYAPPPPDNKLPELENEIDRIVKNKLKEHGTPISKLPPKVPDENLHMFIIRYNIESQLRRIWDERFENEMAFRVRHLPTVRILNDLTKYEVIDSTFQGILREVLSICNYAIHGEKLTINQVKFVTSNANQVLDYLSQVK